MPQICLKAVPYPYFENNVSLQMWEIYGLLERMWYQTTLTLKTMFLCKCGKYMDFGGNMEINIHQILVIWGCGDSYGQDDPRVLFHRRCHKVDD